MRIDAHQHFWNFDPVRDSWIDDSMKVIQRDFSPEDLLPELRSKRIDGCIAVQADQSPQETQYLLGLSHQHPYIKKVVGWVDLSAPDIESQLERYQAEKNLAGFRKILQALPPSAMEEEAFLQGISLLSKYHFTYDILIFPKHLPAALEFVKKFPNQAFIIDHLAKPAIKSGEFEHWSKGIKELSEIPNLYCKVSGMVTEADWKKWKKEDFIPYLDHITDCFGTERLVYGSDWPVCLVAASYAQVFDLAWEYFQPFSEDEKAAIFGDNACEFYGINA
ncbi:amidohydrolase family protein [Cecembia calidifontis]|jgi:L-fuconolactonase|uniref:L-fuconolactonase n=1 Tax=Cecembia calidifontis TaxID=1187080 RepID=A0A4V2F704_9BACT|nr:amidohydrolase family protein [Cecembia calidifontis]RZS98129.1 L-fuconolactonase [Cecembia calidifontis]